MSSWDLTYLIGELARIILYILMQLVRENWRLNTHNGHRYLWGDNGYSRDPLN